MDTIDIEAEPTAKVATEAKPDGRSASSAANGKLGGGPKGKGHADKGTYDPDTLASNLAERIVTGHGLPMNPFSRATAPTEEDNRHVARITGIPVEEFQAKISARLQEIAEKAGMRIVEKLDEGNQKLSDLNMTLAISIDKIAAISGRTAQTGNVSVTVNNYGAMTREQMLATVKADQKSAAIEV